MNRLINSTIAFFLLLVSIPAASWGDPSQALGYTPKYPATFQHFDYVNPQAPKGGEIILPGYGSFDSLNPFTLKGMPPDGIVGLMFDTLMEQSLDEPYSQYGLLAEDVKLAPDHLSVTYRLRPQARFQDGSPVTADDVKFSFDTLKSKLAHPRYRLYWSDIIGATVLDEHTIRFNFAKVNPELHLIVGSIPIFSRHWIGDKPFDQVILQPPVTSGPYRIASFDLGKTIVFERNTDYWARDLPVRRGMYNFDRITYKYYRDSNVALEGFKAGDFDFMAVYNSKEWARDYVGPKFDSGLIRKSEFKHHNNAGMQGFAFNLRRPLFQDIRVRKAITLALDFEWSNRQLFYGQYTRCDSYFSNSELASSGVPEGDELALLAPYREQLPKELFTQPWVPPSTNPPGSLRKNLREAKALLEAAGWHYHDGALRNKDGVPFRINFMLWQKGFERIIAPFARNLAKLGISVEYRTIDMALYQRRSDTFDFDMMVASFPESQSPGNELIGYFGSASADAEGSNNIMGLKNPVVDAMIDKVIYAPDRAHQVTAVHALDRVMLWGEYLVPNWYIGSHRIAYWDRFAYPQQLPLYYDATSWALATWWYRGQPLSGSKP